VIETLLEKTLTPERLAKVGERSVEIIKAERAALITSGTSSQDTSRTPIPL